MDNNNNNKSESTIETEFAYLNFDDCNVCQKITVECH